MDGVAVALTESACETGCTVRSVDPLLLIGLGPPQVAVTVKVTVRSLSVVFAAAV